MSSAHSEEKRGESVSARGAGWIMALACCHPAWAAVLPTCTQLAALHVPSAIITRAVALPARAALPKLPHRTAHPALCRIAATLQPVPESHIRIEVWMPLTHWNGKFLGLGTGGWGGQIPYEDLARALRRGYAAAASDTGHEDPTGSGEFAIGHPEQVIDFSYRAIHEMTIAGKALVRAFYGRSAQPNYFEGCSSGGREALIEAQRYPLDYNGILARSPDTSITHEDANDLWATLALTRTPESALSRADFQLLHHAVLAQCDALDGVRDGVLENPLSCHFDPQVLRCAGLKNPECLSDAQLEAVRAIYSGPRHPLTGELIFPGFEPGSELGWSHLADETEATTTSYSYLVFQDHGWDFHQFDLGRDVEQADALFDDSLNAGHPDLNAFAGAGGKLLMTHGWNDTAIPPRGSLQYYELARAGLDDSGAAADPVRLFMVPGMFHCGGGDGPSEFDGLGALERWFEDHEPPEQLAASRTIHGKVVATHLLCAWPATARYQGGSTDDATHYSCEAP
jgi:tannase/feruloyl esterase